MNNAHAVIDFDGTLVDVRDRYYEVLRRYLDDHGLEEVEKQEFVNGKLAGLKEHEIVRMYTQQELDVMDYIEYKQRHLEKKELLRLDRLFNGTVESLNRLKNSGLLLMLLSVRRNSSNLVSQLEEMHLKSLFSEVIIVKPDKNINPKIKALEGRYLVGCPYIGDSSVDLNCAKYYSMKFFHLSCGLERIDGEHSFTDICDAVNHYLGGN